MQSRFLCDDSDNYPLTQGTEFTTRCIDTALQTFQLLTDKLGNLQAGLKVVEQSLPCVYLMLHEIMAHDEQAGFIPLYLHTNTGDSKDMETSQN